MTASRRVLLAAACAAALGAVVGAADADVPDGPRIAFTADPVEALPDANSLRSANSIGGDVRILGSAVGAGRSELVPELPIAWSPDGERLAVAGYRSGSIWIYIVSASTGAYRKLPGSRGGIFPTFSPDGKRVAFTVAHDEFGSEMATDSAAEFDGTAIRTVDLQTKARRQLTRWRAGLRYVAGTFSPDGSTLISTRADDTTGGRPAVVALDLSSGGSTVILPEAQDPVYSPDGTRIAVIRERKGHRRGGGTEPVTDLYVVDSDGANPQRVTSTPHVFEYLPSWDPSGERLAFTALPGETGEGEDLPAWIGQVNADGTCLQALRRSVSSNFYSAAWRPGPGREAGRIAC